MVKKLAIFNSKGGCCKTTSVFNIAGVLARKGCKVLVIDLDKQCNATKTLLINNEDKVTATMYDYFTQNASLEDIVKKTYFKQRGNAKPRYYGVDVLPSDIRLENEIELAKFDIDIKDDIEAFINDKEYDWVLVDMPPSNHIINKICFTQIVDNVIVPFSCDGFSLQGYSDLLKTIEEARAQNPLFNIVGIYISRYMANCGIDGYIRDELMKFNSFIDIQIPSASDIRETTIFGRPISFYKAHSKSRTAYENLTNYIENKMEELRLAR